MNKTLAATFTLTGTIIGAGFLGMPYAIGKAGYTLGIICLLVLTAIMVLIMLYFNEVIDRTKGTHQLTGYAAKYLGRKGKLIMTLSMVIGIFAALLAYLIVEGTSWSYLISGTAKYSAMAAFIFWAIMALLSYGGINSLKKGESLGVILLLIIIAIIAVSSLPNIDFANLQTLSLKNIGAPIGITIFALLGYSALPEARKIASNSTNLKRAIIYSYLIAFVVYALFVTSILGFYGSKTAEIATLTTGKIVIALGIISVLTSYLALSISMIDMLRYDYNWDKKLAWQMTSCIPAALFAILWFYQKLKFSLILEIGGLISGGLTLILILAMTDVSKRKSEIDPKEKIPYSRIISMSIAVLLVLATILEIINLF